MWEKREKTNNNSPWGHGTHATDKRKKTHVFDFSFTNYLNSFMPAMQYISLSFFLFIMFLLPLWRLGRFGTLEETQNNLGSHACMGNVNVGEMARGLVRKEH